MTKYITIKQAIDITGKSDSTLRRAIKKAMDAGEQITVREKNQVLIDREWLNRNFDISLVMDVEKTSSGNRDLDMIKLQQQVINEQRTTIFHQQNQIDKLQDQVQDKSEKLELSFLKISDMERKLIDVKASDAREQKELTKKRAIGVQDNIFVVLIIIVLIGIIALGVLASK